jgi:hypothetical protein
MSKSPLESLSVWADLYKDPSAKTKSDWDDVQTHFAMLESYYRGDVFNTKVIDPDAAGDTPLLYPVGANLAKTLCLSMADSLFGEWNESVVTFDPARTAEITDAVTAASRQLDMILRASRGNSRLWELELDRQKFGGGIFKINFDKAPHYINWSRIQATEFFPVVDPTNEDRFLAVKIMSRISREQAYEKFGASTNKSEVEIKEIWTNKNYEYWVDEKKIGEFCGENPYGIVPFVYIPRFRSSNWWGESLIDDVRLTQDELNMRLGDLGEAINYNSHPTRWGVNLPRKFNAKNYPLGSNVLWDLGRAFSGAPQPQVGILESASPVPQGVFDYIKWIYDWTRTSVFAPPIAFGEDDGGGQRSGVTLEIRMWPLLKAIRRSRAYLSTGLTNAVEVSARLLEQKNVLENSAQIIAAMRDGSIVPGFSSIMPRDKAALVDEVVKRLSTNPPTISLQEALKVLGSPSSEEEDIDTMVKKYAKSVSAQSNNDSGDNKPNQEQEID